MKHIFVPTDFSDCARNATKYAISIATRFKADVMLYNGYELPYTETDILVNVVDIIKDASKKATDEEVEQYSSIAKEQQVTLHSKSHFGATPNSICIAATENHADLIVMGTHGAGGLTKALIGSNAAGVSKESKIPVLIIPHNCKPSPLKKILFAYDMEKSDSESIFKTLIDFVKNTNAHITILNLNSDVKQLSMESAISGVKLHDVLKDLTHVFVFSDEADKAEGIKAAANKYDAEMIVMVSRHHSLFGSIFNKSVTKQVAYSVELPLLVLPE